MVGAVVTFVGSLVITVFNVRRVLLIWRDPAYFERAARGFRFGNYSMEFRRGLVRGWLPFTIGFAALTVFGALDVYARATGDDAHALLDAQFAMILVLVLGGALMLLVAWFNTPKLLVPPYLRAEPGVRAHRRSRLR